MTRSAAWLEERKKIRSRIMVAIALYFAKGVLDMSNKHSRWCHEQATALVAYLGILMEKGTYTYGVEGNTFVTRIQGKRGKEIVVRVHTDGAMSVDGMFPRSKRSINVPAYMFVQWIIDRGLVRSAVPKLVRANRELFTVFVADHLDCTIPQVSASVRKLFEAKPARRTRKREGTG